MTRRREGNDAENGDLEEKGEELAQRSYGNEFKWP